VARSARGRLAAVGAGVGGGPAKKLRYRLLHTAAPITHSDPGIWLRIAETWPWATDLANTFTRLAALPQPMT
jgi:hypothetical protein